MKKPILTLVFFCYLVLSFAQKENYNIGVLLDNRVPEMDPIFLQLQEQIRVVVGEDANVFFPSENVLLWSCKNSYRWHRKSTKGCFITPLLATLCRSVQRFLFWFRIGNKCIKRKEWRAKGVDCVADFLDENGSFLTWDVFTENYKIKIDYIT